MANAITDRTKVKAPTGPVTTPAEALLAFTNMNKAGGYAERAHSYWVRYTGGTYTATRHWKRYEVYAEIEDQWSDVLRQWLQMLVQTEKEMPFRGNVLLIVKERMESLK